MPRLFVKVEAFLPAKTQERHQIIAPPGAEDPRPKPQNMVILRATKGGRLIGPLPVGSTVLAVGQKLKLVTRGEKVALQSR